MHQRSAVLAKLLGEFHDLTLCPAAIVGRVTVTCADKRAMAAVFSLDVSNVVIRKKRLPRFRQNTHERIVGRVDNQRGPRDATDHVGSGGSGVIIVSAGEAAIVRRHAIVKLPQSFYSAQTRSIEVAGKQTHLAPKSPK